MDKNESMVVRGIREFTVAVSNKLKQNNWDFTSVYSRMKGMTFTLNTKLQDKNTEITILQDAYKPEYNCTIALDNKLLCTMTYTENMNLEDYLNSIIQTLEKISDCELKTNC